MTMRTKILVAGLAGALLLPATWGQEQPALGDVAKQKASTKKAKKVYTDDDLPRGGHSAVSTVGSGTATASASTPGGAAAPGDSAEAKPAEPESKPDAAPASEEVKAQLEKINKHQQEYRNFRKELEEKIANETNPFRKGIYENELRTVDSNIGQLEERRKALEAPAPGGARQQPAPAQEAPKQ